MNNKQIITLIVVAVAAMAIGYFIGTGTSSGVKSESQISLNTKKRFSELFPWRKLGL